MFQDSLLIIKCDYMSKRKTLLKYLLRQGFQIQGHRKVIFSPELAAEFYQDMADDPCFMFQVILLSKGTSEAFILAKECAVEDLINSMVCYFGNSVEMEKNVHVTRCLGKVRKEISFIFPNYISEPIYCPDQAEICSNNPLVSSLINEVCDIVTTPERDPHKSWKEKLVDWLMDSNKDLPRVSYQCSQNPSFNVREMAQQTKVTAIRQHGDPTLTAKGSETSAMCFDTDGTSLNITTSSCVTCSAFASGDVCVQQQEHINMVDMIKSKTVPLVVSKTSSSTGEMKVEGQEDEWMVEEFEWEGSAVGNAEESAEAVDFAMSNGIPDIVVCGSGDVLGSDEKATTDIAGETGQQQLEEQLEVRVSSQQVEFSISPEIEPELLPQPTDVDSSMLANIDYQTEFENAAEELQSVE